MNTKLKLEVEEAIDEVIQYNAENQMWTGYIQPDLSKQMANAAEQVFDASMTGQEFAKSEES